MHVQTAGKKKRYLRWWTMSKMSMQMMTDNAFRLGLSAQTIRVVENVDDGGHQWSLPRLLLHPPCCF